MHYQMQDQFQSNLQLPIDAPPLAVNSPANTDVETRDAAKAVKPIFFMFIFFLLLFNVFIINNKHRICINLRSIFYEKFGFFMKISISVVFLHHFKSGYFLIFLPFS